MPADERREIEAAMDRLLNGTPLRSDGKLTIMSLAAEAGVKRHVLTHKHTDLKDLFNARVRAQDSVPARETVLHEQNASYSASSTTCAPNATSTSRPPTRSPAPSTS